MKANILEQTNERQTCVPGRSKEPSSVSRSLTDSKPNPETPKDLAELAVFLRACLETTTRELYRTNGLRDTMVRELSGRTMALSFSPDGPQAREHLSAMITALQQDDRIRQRLDALAETLSIMSSMLDGVTDADRQNAGNGEFTGREFEESWVNAVLDNHNLDELRQSFAEGLRPAVGDS